MIEELAPGFGAGIIIVGTMFVIYVYQSLKDLNRGR